MAQRRRELLYGYLMRAGVRVHEYGERPLHAKVAVVDDRWAPSARATSTRQPGLNLEANVMVRDESSPDILRERLDRTHRRQLQACRAAASHALVICVAQVRGFFVFHFLARLSALGRVVAAARAQGRVR